LSACKSGSKRTGSLLVIPAVPFACRDEFRAAAIRFTVSLWIFQEVAMKMVLMGDVNLMNVADPGVPFALVSDEFRAADIVFGNLECCLYQPSGKHSVEHEGFFADPDVAGEALLSAGVQAVGLANTSIMARRRSCLSSSGSTGSASRIPGRGPTGRSRALR
jgi:hypothetical protein